MATVVAFGSLTLAQSASASLITPEQHVTINVGDVYDTAQHEDFSGSQFTHNYFFTAGSDLGTNTTAIALNFNPPIQGNVGIANLVLTWLQGASQLANYVVTDGAGVNNDPNAVFFLALTNGIEYTLRATGVALQHNGDYDFSVSAVPVPPAALLFATGLAGLGLLRRRSSSKVKALT